MLKLMLQKFPFCSRIQALMRLYWHHADGSAEETDASGGMSNTSTFFCAIVKVISCYLSSGVEMCKKVNEKSRCTLHV